MSSPSRTNIMSLPVPLSPGNILSGSFTRDYLKAFEDTVPWKSSREHGFWVPANPMKIRFCVNCTSFIFGGQKVELGMKKEMLMKGKVSL